MKNGNDKNFDVILNTGGREPLSSERNKFLSSQYIKSYFWEEEASLLSEEN